MAATLVSRAAVEVQVPVDILAINASLRELEDPIRAISQSADTDDFRWRSWLAHAMGAEFVICPYACAQDVPALSRMGLRIAEVIGASPSTNGAETDWRRHVDFSVSYRPTMSAFWEELQPLLAATDARLSRATRTADHGLDHKVRMRSYVAWAGQTVSSHYVEGLHDTGAIVVDGRGRWWRGLNLAGSGVSVCAEVVALGNALLAGASQLSYVVSVHCLAGGGYRIVPPCAACRRLLATRAPEIRVIVKNADLEAIPVGAVDREA